MKNRGFTLAEVLITLGIIGVVAAITLPVLIAKYKETVTVAKVKETYSIIAQASRRWMDENDCSDDVGLCIEGCSPHTACNMKDLIKYMKVSDVIYKGDGQNRNNKQDTAVVREKGILFVHGSIFILQNLVEIFSVMFCKNL